MSAVPILVVEVVSPDDRERMITRKTGLYRAAGVREQWWVRPAQREVWVVRADGDPMVLTGEAVLACEALVPGFRLPMTDLFR